MSRIENLFQYGKNIQNDNQLDINEALQQSSNPLYESENKINIASYENEANTLIAGELLQYKIVDWFAYRNQRLPLFQNSQKEKRMIASQYLIEIIQEGNILRVLLTYINYIDLQKNQIEREIIL